MRYISLLLGFTLFACGSGEGTGKEGPGDEPECTSPADCLDADEVCNPFTQTCDSNVSCDPSGSALDQCNEAAYCTASGVCRPGTTGTPCAQDENCAGAATCQPLTESCGCSEEEVELLLKPAEIMLVTDYSGSMSSSNRLESQRTAINDLLAAQGADKHFGLLMFPGPNESGCGVEDPQVLPGPNTAQAIQTAMASVGAHGSTPLVPAIEKVVSTDALSLSETGSKVMVVTSDGDPSCADQSIGFQLVQQLQADGVLTFAVVIDNGNVTFMDQLAANGGTGSAFLTSNPAQLATAFSQIASSVASCTFDLPYEPEPGAEIILTVDGVVIPPAVGATPMQGWRLNDQGNGRIEVEVIGPDCDFVQSGVELTTKLLYGCGIDPG